MQKVTIDLSTLGQGLYIPKARTGVHRVVDEIAKGALANANIETLLAAPEYLAETLVHFAKKNHKLATVHAPNDVLLANFEAFLLKLFPAHSIATKAIRAGFYKIIKYKNISAPKLSNTDVYHSPYGPFPEVVQQSKKLKKIITVHDLIELTHPQYFSDKGSHVVRDMLASLTPDTLAVCISEATRNIFLEKSKLPHNQTFVVPLAADPVKFYPCQNPEIIAKTKQQFDINPEAPYLLSIATLEPRKNIPHIIRSFLRTIQEQKIDDLQLVLVGIKGWQFDEIFDELHLSKSLRSRVVLTGYVPDESLAPLYSGALGFVFMSLVEGFGLPPLEAMQCGVPVVVSDSSSLPEVVGDAGIKLSPTDADALCNAMLKIYTDAPLRQRMIAASLRQATHFSWQNFADSYANIYCL